MACKYARRPILPVHICVITELIALCMPICVVSVPFPGRILSLKSSQLCLAFSQASFHSFLIFRRMIVFVVAVKIWSDSGLGCGSGIVRVVHALMLWLAASLAA
ncbi:hypothetical protein K469DRAFT_780310 [Zopfia rhizophila CBS 207.26]|uniref:Uncharacterized protein n=1 Tax=Zopfia rhizophila CBS 207.26 TaxID=1314779 RepID=A0A6A6E4G9_9PEZI|nr:hypothetical protein K469DRAFT_780310 [Zopfia rhizophila CBS 207.26]